MSIGIKESVSPAGATLTGTEVGGGSGETVSLTVLQDDDVSAGKRLDGTGAGLTVGRELHRTERVAVDLCVGVVGLWNADTQLRMASYTEKVQADQYEVVDTFNYVDTIEDIYTYDVSGIVPPQPPSSQDVDGPGPVIPNTPVGASRESQRAGKVVRSMRNRGSTSWYAANDITLDVDMDLYEFWVGPAFRVKLFREASLSVAPRLSLNLVDVSVSRREDFVAHYQDGRSEVLGSWHDRSDTVDWLLGLGVASGLAYDWHNGYFGGIYGSYNWIFDDLILAVGPNTVRIDPSGYEVGMEIGKRF